MTEAERGAISFWSPSPAEMVTQVTEQAEALKAVIDRQGLVVRIRKREHVRIEGWQTLGAMVGVFAVIQWSRPIPRPEAYETLEGEESVQTWGYEARALAQTRSGEIVGAGEAECTRSETLWSTRDDFMLRSMAQTRAQAKALRGPLGFVVALAGYEATPSEEMEGLLAPRSVVKQHAMRLADGDKDKAKDIYLAAMDECQIENPDDMEEDQAIIVMKWMDETFLKPLFDTESPEESEGEH